MFILEKKTLFNFKINFVKNKQKIYLINASNIFLYGKLYICKKRIDLKRYIHFEFVYDQFRLLN